MITATEAIVGDKVLLLKKTLDEALGKLDGRGTNTIKHVLVAAEESDCSAIVWSATDIELEKVCGRIPHGF